MNAIIENTETAYAMDTITAYLPEVEMFNEVVVEITTSQFFYNLNIIADKALARDAEIAYPIETDINPFDEVITELKRYTQQTSITYYHRITLVELVRVGKDRNMTNYNNTPLLGRVVNKKSGVECEYTDKQQVLFIRNQLPELRRTYEPKEMDYKITLYPIIKPTKPYIGPTTLKPIIITLRDVLKETPFDVPNLIECEYTNLIGYKHFSYDMNGRKIEREGYTTTYELSLTYKIIMDRGEERDEAILATALSSQPTSKLIYDTLLPKLLPYIYIPTPYRLYKITRHQNKLLTLLVGMKRWDYKGNPLLTGCKAIRYYDNAFVKESKWSFNNYTTKKDLETFMGNCGYIQYKLYTEGTPITKKAIDNETKIINKTSYQDIALWLYKQY